ncbi:type 1 glutamine amidotransferase domain-containing protein [Burkholderia pyrrocinia]
MSSALRKMWMCMVSVILGLGTVAAFAAAPQRVLIVVTSHADTRPVSEGTGLWLGELVEPYWIFTDAGMTVDIASIRGGRPPVDSRSESPDKPSGAARRFANDPQAQRKFANTLPIAQVKSSDYDVIFLAGGHGTLWDFTDNPDLSRVGSEMFRQGKIVAAVCHGPAGLLGMTDRAGKPLLQGRRATGFTNEEEHGNPLESVIPYRLEIRMRAAGARFEKRGRYEPYVVRNGQLITGQNPQSAELTARAVVERIAKGHP